MDKIKIRFFSDSYKPKRASHRLRGELICNALTDHGYDSKILKDWEEVDKNTIVVFLKHTLPESINRAKLLGALTVYDLCDNKFDEDEAYIPCCMAADIISANSENMKISVKENTGKDSIVMPDPFERPKLEAKFKPGKEIKLLWFGSQSSLGLFPLVEVWERLEKELVNYNFTMIMSKPERLENKMKKRKDAGVISSWINFNKIQMHDWDWDLQGQFLKECDIVLMPVHTDNYRTITKSANRVIDSLISGRFVVTSPLDSYLEFKNYTWQDDYIQGIKWAIEHPGKALEKIQAGQAYTEENYSARVLSKKYIEEIKKHLGK
jgi:glycosyltransferase involved in cell wall biosynthesis